MVVHSGSIRFLVGRLLILLTGVFGCADCFSVVTLIKTKMLSDPSAQPNYANTINLSKPTMSLLKDTETSENADECFFRKTEQNIEETTEESQLRQLWDSDPFETVTAFVQSVVSSSDKMALSRLWLCATENNTILAPPPLPEEYQQLFARAFRTSIVSQHAASITATSNSVEESLLLDEKKEEYKGFYSFRLEIAYMGEAFCGWQTQPHNKERPSVQQTLEDHLQPMFQPSRRTKKYLERADGQSQNPNKNKKTEIKEPRVNIRVAGRTDAGVHAIGQVARFRTWSKGGGESTFQWNDIALLPATDDATPSNQLQEYINQHPLAGKTFRCASVTPISSKFHPTFGASCRAYLYLIDASSVQQMLDGRNESSQLPSISLGQLIQRLNTMLGALKQQELDYVAMSYGKVKTQSTLCNLQVARAFCVNTTGGGDPEKVHSALCIQLVGDRFLRRMVRILVSTALRAALSYDASGDDEPCDEAKRLVDILQSKDRRMSARPAPPQGLLFAGASFEL